MANDKPVNEGVYGNTIPIMFGSARLPTSPVWAGPYVLNSDNSQDVTFAVIIGKRDPLSSGATLSKVWIDGVLVYANDGTEVSGDAFDAVFYDGSETQQKDPTIVALEGEDKTPAFRDRMYLVIKAWNVPAAQQFPSVECEVVQRISTISKRYANKFASDHTVDGTHTTTIRVDFPANMLWELNQNGVGSFDIDALSHVGFFYVNDTFLGTGRYTPYIFFANRYTQKLYVYDIYGNSYMAAFDLVDFASFISASPVLSNGMQHVFIAAAFGAFTVASFDPFTHTMAKLYDAALTYEDRDPYSNIKFLPIAKMRPSVDFTFGYFMKHRKICLTLVGIDDSIINVGKRVSYYTDADGVPGGKSVTDYLFAPGQTVECADLLPYLTSIGKAAFKPFFLHCDPQEGKWISIILTNGTEAIWIKLETVFAKLGIQRPGHTLVGSIRVPNYPPLPPLNHLSVTDYKVLPGAYFDWNSCWSCADGENTLLGQHDGNNYFLDMMTGTTVIIPMGQLIDNATNAPVAGYTGEISNSVWNNSRQSVFTGGIFNYWLAPVEYQLYVAAESRGTLKLSNFVKSLAMLADIPLDDITTDNIDDEFVGGMLTSETDFLTLLNTLGTAFRFDVIDLGGKLKASRRVRDASFSVDATYYETDLAYLVQGSVDDGSVLDKKRDSIDTLPSSLTFTYIASENSYQSGAYTAKRTMFPAKAVNSGTAKTISVPVAMTTAMAARWAEAALFDAWGQAITVSFMLPSKQLALTAGDYVSVVTPTKGVYTLRVNQVYVNTDFSLSVSGRTVSAIAPDDTSLRDFDITPPPSPRTLTGNFACHIVDNIALHYGETIQCFYAFGSEPLNVFFTRPDGSRAVHPISAGVPIGRLLAPMPATPLWAIDLPQHDAILNVRMSYNSIGAETITDAQWFAGERIVIIGSMGRWEAVSYKQLTINGDGTITLTGLIRGQLGSDTVNERLVGDVVIFLTQPAVAIPYSLFNNQRAQMKAAYPNTLPTSSTAKAVAAMFTGGSIKPWAPVHVRASVLSGDVVFSWNRRDRGPYTGAFDDPPLSDTPLSFDVEVIAGDGTVKRTFAAVAAETVTYTAAMLASDGFTTASTFVLRIYQNSPVVGRGHMRTITCLAS